MEWKHLEARAKRGLPWESYLSAFLVLFLVAAFFNISKPTTSSPKLKLASLTELSDGTSTTPINVDLTQTNLEAGETSYYYQHSAWWKYTASSSYSVTFSAAAPSGNIAICVGTTIGNCSGGMANGSGTFAMTSGTSYYIRVSSNTALRGVFMMTRGILVDSYVAPYDDFANAQVIAEPTAGTSTLTNVDMNNLTTQSGEVAVTGTAKTAWFKYTPSASYTADISIQGLGANIASCVTTSLGSCTQGTNGGNNNTAYALTSGTTYFIRVNPNTATFALVTIARAGADNDIFANATTISELAAGTTTGSMSVDNFGTTFEVGEGSVERGRWFKYTATANQTVNIMTQTSWGVSLNLCLTTVMTSCSIAYTNSLYAANLTSGTTYYLRLGQAEQGSFVVTRAGNDNDQFANATNIAELSDGQSTVTMPVNYSNATTEPTESSNGNRSRWYKYTPSANQTLNISQGGLSQGGNNNFYQCVTTSITTCTGGYSVIYSYGSYGYALTSGTTYYLRLSTSGATDGTVRFTRSPADNDLIANATTIPELAAGANTGTISFDLSNAGLEATETTTGFRSRWWKYTPTTNQSVTIAEGAAGNANGRALYQCVTTSLTSCGVGNAVYGESSFSYSLTSGTTYYFRMSTSGTDYGSFRVTRSGSDNDSFANATVITELTAGGSTPAINADLTVATKEGGEFGQGVKSRWWSYTPTANQLVNILESTPSPVGSGVIDQCVTTAFGSCTNGDNGGYGKYALGYNLIAGTTYYIRIATLNADHVDFVLSRGTNDNDQFANATAIAEVANNTATSPFAFDLSGATIEPGEGASSGYRSRWWSYTPTASYSIRIDAGAYTTGSSAVLIACLAPSISGCSANSIGFTNNSYATWALTAGTTYYLHIGTNGPSSGTFTLSRGTVADGYVPPNDNFANATTLAELSPNAKGTNQTVNLTNATVEGGEVSAGTARSAWWKYTPTSSYTLDLLIGGDGGHLWSCVTTANASCTEASNGFNGTYAFALTSGTTYYIRLSPNGSATNYGTFAISRTNSGNDNFASATPISELAAGASTPLVNVDTSGATYEPSETTPAGGDRQSLWWSYTPTSSYTVNVVMHGANGELAHCFTTSMTSCTGGSGSANGYYAYNVTAGTTYYLRITNNSTPRGGFRITRAGTNNDNFANATPLSEVAAGTTSSPTTFDLANATQEPGELSTGENRSLWWSYTPNSSYTLNVTPSGDGGANNLCITTSMTTCSIVQGTGNQGSAVTVSSGTTYYFRIASLGATTGSFTLRRAGGGNDNFANATSISEVAAAGTSPMIPVDARNATVEAGEYVLGEQRSLWWSYTPTSSYTINLFSYGEMGDMVHCITTSIGSCSVAAQNAAGTYAYALTGGTTYYIRFSASTSNTAAFAIGRVGAGNDTFANATTISELASGAESSAINFDTSNATIDTGEINTYQQRSLWWKYTPTSNYTIDVDASGDGGGTSSCVTTSIASCSLGSSTGTVTNGYALTAGTTYYIRIAGNGWNTGRLIINRSNSANNDLFANATNITQWDITKPTTGTVYDGSNAGVETSSNSGSTNSLSANWPGFSDAGTGIANYEYSIGTSAGNTSVANWTSAGMATSVTATGLSLTIGQRYYFNVRATDYAGNVSNIVSSTGQVVSATLSFTITGAASGTDCGDVTTNQASGNSAATLNPPTNGTQGIAGANISVITNAPGGYVVNVSAAPMASGARTIAAAPGTNAAPQAWPATNTESFGYATSSNSLSGTAARFRTGKFAAFNATQSEVMRNAAATAGDSSCVALGISKSAITPAGSYSTQVVFAAVPTF